MGTGGGGRGVRGGGMLKMKLDGTATPSLLFTPPPHTLRSIREQRSSIFIEFDGEASDSGPVFGVLSLVGIVRVLYRH